MPVVHKSYYVTIPIVLAGFALCIYAVVNGYKTYKFATEQDDTRRFLSDAQDTLEIHNNTRINTEKWTKDDATAHAMKVLPGWTIQTTNGKETGPTVLKTVFVVYDDKNSFDGYGVSANGEYLGLGF